MTPDKEYGKVRFPGELLVVHGWAKGSGRLRGGLLDFGWGVPHAAALYSRVPFGVAANGRPHQFEREHRGSREYEGSPVTMQ